MTITNKKTKYTYKCIECDASFPSWQGQCPSCSQWNSIEKEEVIKQLGPRILTLSNGSKPMKMSQVTVTEDDKISTCIPEFDRVLGEGFIRGAVILLGGEPGIGKSTLALQIAQKCAHSQVNVLYISGEESLSQIYMRSERTGDNPDSFFVLSETNIQHIIHIIRDHKPDVVILDSIQVVFNPEVSSVPGSVNQVRQCGSDLIAVAKSLGIVTLMIGHITKDGALAGPKVLEHLVDVILYLEGERNQQYRLLRSLKNRYSSTREIGIFEMVKSGLKEVPNPSALFIDDGTLFHPGSMVSPVAEGNRIILVELQALVVDSGYGMAKRTYLGVDQHRCNLMIAAIEKIIGLKLSSKDIILNIVGGIKITEPACDLTILMAIISSYYNLAFPNRVGVFGEVGLTGEIRPVSQVETRLNELEKMGFQECVLPKKNQLKNTSTSLRLHYINNIDEALKLFGKKTHDV